MDATSSGPSVCFGKFKAEIARVNLGRGKGVFYRLVAGPLKNDADVKRVCRQLKSRRQYCEPAFMAMGAERQYWQTVTFMA